MSNTTSCGSSRWPLSPETLVDIHPRLSTYPPAAGWHAATTKVAIDSGSTACYLAARNLESRQSVSPVGCPCAIVYASILLTHRHLRTDMREPTLCLAARVVRCTTVISLWPLGDGDAAEGPRSLGSAAAEMAANERRTGEGRERGAEETPTSNERGRDRSDVRARRVDGVRREASAGTPDRPDVEPRTTTRACLDGLPAEAFAIPGRARSIAGGDFVLGIGVMEPEFVPELQCRDRPVEGKRDALDELLPGVDADPVEGVGAGERSRHEPRAGTCRPQDRGKLRRRASKQYGVQWWWWDPEPSKAKRSGHAERRKPCSLQHRLRAPPSSSRPPLAIASSSHSQAASIRPPQERRVSVPPEHPRASSSLRLARTYHRVDEKAYPIRAFTTLQRVARELGWHKHRAAGGGSSLRSYSSFALPAPASLLDASLETPSAFPSRSPQSVRPPSPPAVNAPVRIQSAVTTSSIRIYASYKRLRVERLTTDGQFALDTASGRVSLAGYSTRSISTGAVRTGAAARRDRVRLHSYNLRYSSTGVFAIQHIPWRARLHIENPGLTLLRASHVGRRLRLMPCTCDSQHTAPVVRSTTAQDNERPVRARVLAELVIALRRVYSRRTSMPKRLTRHPTDSSPPDYSAIPSSDTTINPARCRTLEKMHIVGARWRLTRDVAKDAMQEPRRGGDAGVDGEAEERNPACGHERAGGA
ncbi:hypothetical protein VTO73DRAFT_13097 [Trametes versicolor]